MGEVMNVKVKLLHERARVPEYAKHGDAGCDLRAVESTRLKFGEPKVVPLGVAVEIPDGYVGLIQPRSSLSKCGVHCATGILDSGFRGEIGATLTLLNSGHVDFEVHIGDKVAQLVIVKCERAVMEVAERLSSSERGEGGWGHTGR